MILRKKMPSVSVRHISELAVVLRSKAKKFCNLSAAGTYHRDESGIPLAGDNFKTVIALVFGTLELSPILLAWTLVVVRRKELQPPAFFLLRMTSVQKVSNSKNAKGVLSTILKRL